MTATATPLRPELAASLKVAAQPPQRELDLITINEIKKRLTAARIELHQALLFARGCDKARDTIISAGHAARAALDVFEAAHQRGKL